MGIPSSFLGQAASAVKGLVSDSGSSLSNFINQASQGDIAGALAGLGNQTSVEVDTLGARGLAEPGDALGGMNARGDAIQNWSWYCLMPTLTNNNTQSIAGSRASTPLPWYYVQKCNAPFRLIETESIKRNSAQVHLPIGYSVPNLAIEFFMDSNNVAQKYLKAWGALVLDTAPVANVVNRGVWGLPAGYKKNIYVYVLSVTKKQLLNFKFINCWPNDPQALELMSADPAVLVQTVNFMVEDVEVTVLNDKGVIDNLIEAGTGYAIDQLTGFASSFL